MTPNQLGLIFADYLYRHHNQRGVIVRTLPTSRGMDRLARRLAAL